MLIEVLNSLEDSEYILIKFDVWSKLMIDLRICELLKYLKKLIIIITCVYSISSMCFTVCTFVNWPGKSTVLHNA